MRVQLRKVLTHSETMLAYRGSLALPVERSRPLQPRESVVKTQLTAVMRR